MALISSQSSATANTRSVEEPPELTNWREAAGYFLAWGFKAAALYLLIPTLLLPFYQWLTHTGVDALTYVGTLSISALVWLGTLLLFLLLRALLGGVPAIVAPRDHRHAFTSPGREIAAYILASLYTLMIFSVFSERLLSAVYSALRVNGQIELVASFTRVVLSVTAVAFFWIFVALRRAILKADELARAADRSRRGASLGFGQAVAICFGKYAESNGRAN